MSDSETVKRLLLSVLDLGDRSPLFSQFFGVCCDMSLASLSISRNKMFRNELVEKLGCSPRDLACDCIADLFENRQGRFIRIDNFFQRKFPGGVEDVHPDMLLVNLAVLIKSRVNQQISELRQNTGEIYFSIKKALMTDLNRRKNIYRRFTYKGAKFIRLGNASSVDMELPQIDIECLVSELMAKHLNNRGVAAILPCAFEILAEQNSYCEAIEEKLLLNALKIYYARHSDS